MVYEILNSDTLNTAKDTLAAAVENSEVLQEIKFDPSAIIAGDGIFISIVGYLIVFLALVLLFLVFSNITKVLQLNVRKRLAAKGEVYEGGESGIQVSGETNAAISMALYLYFEELHDLENTVLTIKKVEKAYSPWSSKIYGLRQFPKK